MASRVYEFTFHLYDRMPSNDVPFEVIVQATGNVLRSAERTAWRKLLRATKGQRRDYMIAAHRHVPVSERKTS